MYIFSETMKTAQKEVLFFVYFEELKKQAFLCMMKANLKKGALNEV